MSRTETTKNEEIATTEDIDPESNEKFKTHPDGGWGWCIVIAAFLTQFVVVGLQNSSGVIFNELVEKFNRPRGETGFVSSISCGMMFLLGPVTTGLCQKFSCRVISILGGFLCMLGMFASAYASSLKIMYVTFGFTWGLGTSFCYFPTLIILVPYFDKRLALVNGIVSSGSGIGTLILSPFIQWFARNYGVQKMFFMLAALHCIVFVAGFVYLPISDTYKERQGIKIKKPPSDKEPEKVRQDTQETLVSLDSGTQLNRPLLSVDDSMERAEGKGEEERGCVNSATFNVVLSLYHDKAFIAWCLGLSVFMLGYFVPFVHLVRYATLIGIPEVKAAFLISTLSIVATFFKVLSGKVAGLKNVDTFKLYQMGLLTMGVATTLIPVSHSYVGLVIYAVVFGISESCFIVMIPILTKEIVGVRRLPLALGCVFMIMGVPTVVGAPIAGWIYDAFGDYSYAFYVAGSMNTLGVLIMFFVVLFREKNEITAIEKTIIKEDTKPRPTSQVIEFTCYASSDRIFYSQMDLLDVDNTLRHNNRRFRASNTSINQNGRIPNVYGSTLSPQSAISRPESPSIIAQKQNAGEGNRKEQSPLKLLAQLLHNSRRKLQYSTDELSSLSSTDSNFYFVDSVVTSL